MGWGCGSPEAGTPLFSRYPSHPVCLCLPALCQLGRAGVSTQDLSPRRGPFPSPPHQPAPGPPQLTRRVLALETLPGAVVGLQTPKKGVFLFGGEHSGLCLDKEELCVFCCQRPPWLLLSCAFPRLSQLQIRIFSFAQPFLLWVPPLLGAAGPRFSRRNVLLCTAAGSR